MTSIESRLQRLHIRKQDPRTGRVAMSDSRARRSFEKLAKAIPIEPDDVRVYISESMAAVDAARTDQMLQTAESVRSHLSKELQREGLSVDFEYQGSVTNNTHIRVHSDIDLLVLTDSFTTLERPLVVTAPFSGNPVDELIELREKCETILELHPQAPEVDCSGSKSICVTSSRLLCDVDVVPGNWVETKEYRETWDKIYKGVNILDKSKRTRIKNFPFLHNKRIDERDVITNGNFRRLVRLLKAVRDDSDSAPLVSSYDIAGLCYNMGDDYFERGSESNNALIIEFSKYCLSIIADDEAREAVYVPNGQRKIFCAEGLGIANLMALLEELLHILNVAATPS